MRRLAFALALLSCACATPALADTPGKVRKIIRQDDVGASFDGDLAGSTLTDSTNSAVTLDVPLVLANGERISNSTNGTITLDDGAGGAADLAVLGGIDVGTGATGVTIGHAGTGSLWVKSGSGNDLFLGARGATLGNSQIRVSSAQVSLQVQLARLGRNSDPTTDTWTSTDATGVTLTESIATVVATVSMPADSLWSGMVKADTYATDGTEDQVRAGLYLVTIKNDGGTISGTVTEVSTQAEVSSGTLTHTITVSDAGSNVANVNCNAVSSLTQTTLNCRLYSVSAANLGGTTSIGNP